MAIKGEGCARLRDLTQHLTTRADDSHAAPVTRSPKRKLRDLTQHLTTRADDSHAAPVFGFPKAQPSLLGLPEMSRAGKVLRVSSN